MADPVAAPPGYTDNGDGSFTDPMTGETVYYSNGQYVTADGQVPAGLSTGGNNAAVDGTVTVPMPDGSSSQVPASMIPTGAGGQPISGSDLANWASQNAGLINSAIGAAGTLASGQTAIDALNKAASTYTNTAQADNTILNPYGAYRDASAQALAKVEADPSSVAQTPGYQFALQQGLGAVGNRDNQKFGVGAGSTNPDLMNYASGLASQTYNNTISQLQAQAGVGIAPTAEGSLLNTALQGTVNANLGAANVTNTEIASLTQPGKTATPSTPGGTAATSVGGGTPGSSVASSIINAGIHAATGSTPGSSTPTITPNPVSTDNQFAGTDIVGTPE